MKCQKLFYQKSRSRHLFCSLSRIKFSIRVLLFSKFLSGLLQRVLSILDLYRAKQVQDKESPLLCTQPRPVVLYYILNENINMIKSLNILKMYFSIHNSGNHTWFFFSAPHCPLLKTTAIIGICSRIHVNNSLKLIPHAPSPTYAIAGRSGRPNFAPIIVGKAY